MNKEQIEEWREKIKRKIWAEFCGESNEAHGKRLMASFDELCDLALSALSGEPVAWMFFDTAKDEHGFSASPKPYGTPLYLHPTDADLAKRLLEAADEIALKGHNGWGNLMREAADALGVKR